MRILSSCIFALAILTVSCQKEDDPKPDITAGICYGMHTEIVESDCDVQISINDSIISFQKTESFYGDAENGNVFHIDFFSSSSSLISMVEFDLYLPRITPEDFFQVAAYEVNTIQLWHSYPNYTGFGDYYNNVDMEFRWDSIELVDQQFRGVGSIILNEDIVSILDTSCHFSKQKIDFEIQ